MGDFRGVLGDDFRCGEDVDDFGANRSSLADFGDSWTVVVVGFAPSLARDFLGNTTTGFAAAGGFLLFLKEGSLVVLTDTGFDLSGLSDL